MLIVDQAFSKTDNGRQIIRIAAPVYWLTLHRCKKNGTAHMERTVPRVRPTYGFTRLPTVRRLLSPFPGERGSLPGEEWPRFAGQDDIQINLLDQE